MVKNALISVEEANYLIRQGHSLLFAGEESLLADLEKGTWIGGTIPYFMGPDGGTFDTERLFVTDLPSSMTVSSTRFYSHAEIQHIFENSDVEGISFIIIPFGSAAHTVFAEGAPGFDEYLMRPLIGWVSGCALAGGAGLNQPKVFLGKTMEESGDKAVVMHCRLNKEAKARIDIVNVFTPDPKADLIQFEETGFMVTNALINGERQRFCDYLQKTDANTTLPLVTDQYGAMINVSIRSVDRDSGTVEFYTPVFPRLSYRFALPVDDYAGAFEAIAPNNIENAVFSSNCVLNYLYAGLEGRMVGRGVFGPITFGEIAYQLLNQTLVYAVIEARGQ